MLCGQSRIRTLSSDVLNGDRSFCEEGQGEGHAEDLSAALQQCAQHLYAFHFLFCVLRRREVYLHSLVCEMNKCLILDEAPGFGLALTESCGDAGKAGD